MDALRSTRSWGRGRWHSDLRSRVHRILDPEYSPLSEKPFAEIVSLVSASPQNASAVAEAIGESLTSTSERTLSNTLDLVEDILNSPNPSTTFYSATSRFMNKILSLADSQGPTAEKARQLLESWKSNHPRLASLALHKRHPSDDMKAASMTSATDSRNSGDSDKIDGTSFSNPTMSAGMTCGDTPISAVMSPLPTSYAGQSLYTESSDGTAFIDFPDVRREATEFRGRTDSHSRRRMSEGASERIRAQARHTYFLDGVRDMLSSFESLHTLQMKPLNDPDIERVRIQLEEALPMLRYLLTAEDDSVTDKNRQESRLFENYIACMMKQFFSDSGDDANFANLTANSDPRDSSCSVNTHRPGYGSPRRDAQNEEPESHRTHSASPDEAYFEFECHEGAACPADVNASPSQQALLVSIYRLLSKVAHLDLPCDVKWWEPPVCELPSDLSPPDEPMPVRISDSVPCQPSFTQLMFPQDAYFSTVINSPGPTHALPAVYPSPMPYLGPSSTPITQYTPATFYTPQPVTSLTYHPQMLNNWMPNRGH